MSKQDIVVCGLRYGKTKFQAELIKKYIEENFDEYIDLNNKENYIDDIDLSIKEREY